MKVESDFMNEEGSKSKKKATASTAISGKESSTLKKGKEEDFFHM